MNLTVRLNQFASLFRDIGDGDYISARANYQLHLREQFFWAGLQALEKYLKAILLHNGQSTLKYSHNLPELLKAVRQISYLKFQIPVGVEEFLTRLRDLGDNRYLSTDTYVRARVADPPYGSSSRIPPNRQRPFSQQEKTELAKFIYFPRNRKDIFL
jgi:HEPN domain-containing protein